jgi:uncharacterized membrane protein required for colicin V production
MNMNFSWFPFNAFDFLVALILVGGLLRGRKQGMSSELLALSKWLAVLFVCAVAYEPIGSFFNQSTSMLSMLACYLLAYIGSALVIVLVFMGIHRALGGKLIGSDVFGKTEYYLGMGSGLLRFACGLLVGLALLNAPYYSPKKVQAMEKFQNDNYGSNFFPTLYTVQSSVFERSVCGKWIREHLGFLLIKPTEGSGDKKFHQADAPWQ